MLPCPDTRRSARGSDRGSPQVVKASILSEVSSIVPETDIPGGLLALVVQALARHRELDALAGAVLEALRDALPLAGATLYLMEEEPERVLRPVAERPAPEGGAPPRATPVPPDSADPRARAAASREPQLDEDQATRQLHACFPLIVGKRVEGVLEVLGEREALSDSRRELLATAADIIAVAVHGARNETAANQLEAMRQASLAISEALAVLPPTHLRAALARGLQIWPRSQVVVPSFLRSVLQHIVDHARQVAGAQYAALGLGGSAEQSFEPWVFSGISAEVAARIGRHPRPVATLGVVARQGHSIRMRDVHRHPAFTGFPPHHPPMTSILAVPLVYQGVSLGNLYLTNKLGAGEFSADDQRAIELFASQAAMALQQSYLRMAAEAQYAQMQSILESAPHGILFVDAKSGDVMANPRAMELFGRPIVPREGRAQYAALLCYPDGRALSVDEELSSRVLRGEDVSPQEFQVVRGDGTRLAVLGSAGVVRGLDNEVIGVVEVFEDLSAIKELERLREELATMVAHDLRSPLQSMLLQVETLARGAQDGQVVVPLERVQRLERSASYLARLVASLLDATQLELHRLPLARVSRALPELIAEVVERLRPVLGSHPVDVRVEGSPPAVPVDVLRFQQILTNLLENAAKYSGDGAAIFVRLAPARGGAVVTVQDTGEGIEPADLPRLFDRFFQSRRAREKRTGLGLGLYITKGLVEAHGGSICVDSAPGQGTSFHIWLPGGEHATGAHEPAPAS